MEIPTSVRAPQPNAGLAEVAAQRMIQPSIRTELPATQTVSAVGAAERTEPDTRQDAASDAALRRAAIESSLVQRQRDTVRRVDRDEASNELVFRSIDAATGEVIAQFPDELILRNRTYYAQQAQAQTPRSDTAVERIV
jgi:uncharacterized FlaG/YvyC family protein